MLVVVVVGGWWWYRIMRWCVCVSCMGLVTRLVNLLLLQYQQQEHVYFACDYLYCHISLKQYNLI